MPQVPMLKAIALRLGSALLVLLVVYLPVTGGQDLSSDRARCVNRGKAFSLDEQIDGCTAILQLDRRTAANRAGIYTDRGGAYYDKKDYDRAIADYNEAIRRNPQLATTAYAGRGLAYFEKTDYDRAIADYNEAIRINPNFALAYNNRAWTYFKTGKAAQGLPDAERSLQLHPDYFYALDTRGHIFEALGRREEAIADFRRALAQDPSNESGRDALKRLGAAP